MSPDQLHDLPFMIIFFGLVHEIMMVITIILLVAVLRRQE